MAQKTAWKRWLAKWALIAVACLFAFQLISNRALYYDCFYDGWEEPEMDLFAPIGTIETAHPENKIIHDPLARVAWGVGRAYGQSPFREHALPPWIRGNAKGLYGPPK